MKTMREINIARRNNPTLSGLDAAIANLYAATTAVESPEEHRDQSADIRGWFTAADRAYNARVAAAREAGTLDRVPPRRTTPMFWEPEQDDVWMTQHGWEWQLRGGRMVAWSGCEMPVEGFRGLGPVLVRRLGVRPLWVVVESVVGG